MRPYPVLKMAGNTLIMFRYLDFSLKRYSGKPAENPVHAIEPDGTAYAPGELKRLFAESERIAKRALARCDEL